MENILQYEFTGEKVDFRLDAFLASLPVSLSRSRAQALIKEGRVRVNDTPSKPSYRLRAGDRVKIFLPPKTDTHLDSDQVEFRIIYEDDCLIVLSKPAGVVVHPGAGHHRGTLVQGLLQYYPELREVGEPSRPGIVHRLDKDTSGLMVVAKKEETREDLVRLFQQNRVKKQYTVIVHGVLSSRAGRIDRPIGRHPKQRKRMSVTTQRGKRAVTLWQKTEELSGQFTLLVAYTRTGRSHQIRVHFSHIGYPILGDPVYGYGKKWWRKQNLEGKGVPPPKTGQMLHAHYLGFFHPEKARYMEFGAPIPEEMVRTLDALRSWSSRA